MRRTLRRTSLLALLALASLAAAAPAGAQNQPQGPSRRGGNQSMIDAAVESYGFNPRRLTASQEEALDAAWERLLPGEARATYRLNSTQALAMAYVGLVLRQQPDGDRRPPRRGDGGDGRDERGAVCRPLIDAVFTLAGSSPVLQNTGMSLSAEEITATRRSALAIQQQAVECGCPAVASAAAEIGRLLGASRPSRSVIGHRITALTTVVQDCTAPREAAER
jgi:hypothetical protein